MNTNITIKTALILLVSITVFLNGSVNANDDVKPTVIIESPIDNECYWAKEEIEFRCKAYDLEDGALSGKNVKWVSDLDNTFGYGTAFKAKLSKGLHMISVIASDRKNKKGRSSVIIMVSDKKPSRPEKKPEQNKPMDNIPIIQFTCVPKIGSHEDLLLMKLKRDRQNSLNTIYHRDNLRKARDPIQQNREFVSSKTGCGIDWSKTGL